MAYICDGALPERIALGFVLRNQRGSSGLLFSDSFDCGHGKFDYPLYLMASAAVTVV